MIVDGDVGAHTRDLRSEHEAVLENVLRDDGIALGQRGEQHELRLKVRGEAGVRKSLNVHRLQRLAALDGDEVLACLHIAAHGTQLQDGHAQIVGLDALDGEGASQQSSAGQIGAGFDAVAHRGVLARVHDGQRHALDLDRRGAGAPDLGAHCVEHIRQILDLGLAGGIVDGGGALGHHGGHHRVLRGPHAGEFQHNAATMQPLGRGGDEVAMVHLEGDAQLLEPHQMHVDLAGADLAAAGHGNMGLPETAHQRAERGDARTHLADQLVRRLVFVDRGSVDDHIVALAADRSPQSLDDLAHNGDIGNDGHIVQRGLALTENSGRHELESGVLSARDLHRTDKVGRLAGNDDFF